MTRMATRTAPPRAPANLLPRALAGPACLVTPSAYLVTPAPCLATSGPRTVTLASPNLGADQVGARIVAAAPDIGVLPEPDERPPATRDRLQPGTVLGTQWATFHADKAGRYLDEISEDHPAFRSDGRAHPGWLLRFANWALSSTVRLGPWIHVASDAWFLRSVRDGDTIEVRAVITDRFERKGHEFVDLAVVMRVDERIVLSVDHRAIWQPRRAD